jgi:hypothetical protein
MTSVISFSPFILKEIPAWLAPSWGNLEGHCTSVTRYNSIFLGYDALVPALPFPVSGRSPARIVRALQFAPKPLVSAQVLVLHFNQPGSAIRGPRIPRDVAEEMVRRMICERLSAKKIRMFPPDSVFPILKALPPSILAVYEQLILATGPELPGIRFKEPISALWRKDPFSKAACVRMIPPQIVASNMVQL